MLSRLVDDMGWTRCRVEAADGIGLAADIGGEVSGVPVILLHGGGQQRRSWSRTMRVLVDRGYRVVNIDLRGHGESEWSARGDYGLEAFAADLRATVGMFDSPPIVIGASLGGATALTLAGQVDAPALRSIVLVDIVPEMNLEGTGRIEAFLRSGKGGFATLDEAAEAVRAYRSSHAREGSVEGLRRNLRIGRDGRFYWHWDPRFMEGPGAVDRIDIRAVLQQAATRVRCPIALVRGGRSDVVTDAGVAALRRIVPALHVIEVDRATHMVVGDVNDAFNHAIDEYLGAGNAASVPPN